jgi:hypothetical protein
LAGVGHLSRASGLAAFSFRFSPVPLPRPIVPSMDALRHGSPQLDWNGHIYSQTKNQEWNCCATTISNTTVTTQRLNRVSFLLTVKCITVSRQSFIHVQDSVSERETVPRYRTARHNANVEQVIAPAQTVSRQSFIDAHGHVQERAPIPPHRTRGQTIRVLRRDGKRPLLRGARGLGRLSRASL